MEHLDPGGLRAHPIPTPSSHTHLLTKGSGGNPESHISATTHRGSVPGACSALGQWAAHRQMAWAPFVHFVFAFHLLAFLKKSGLFPEL